MVRCCRGSSQRRVSITCKGPAAALSPDWNCSKEGQVFPLPAVSGERVRVRPPGETFVAAPHPDPLPVREHERGEGENGGIPREIVCRVGAAGNSCARDCPGGGAR